MKVKVKTEAGKILKHPIGGAFRGDGTADWPDDAYTHRRVYEDGDVEIVEEHTEPKKEKAAKKEG